VTTKNNSAVKPPGLKFTIERVISAPCRMVYAAWTDPRQMVQWWSPENIECRSVTADLKIGGAYRIHMVAEQGDHIAIGHYLEIIPNKRLRFTWQWEHYPLPHSTVTVEFEDLGKTTRLTLTHEGLPDAEDVPDHKTGWTSAIEKFARLMAENKIKAG
jgi:uncharacterized protein YndB with AHSA1/START domain